MKSNPKDKKSSSVHPFDTNIGIRPFLNMWLSWEGSKEYSRDEKILTGAVEYLESPQLLLNEIIENPLSILRDQCVQVSLEILHYMADVGGLKTNYSRWAEDFLKILGISAFIPKRPKNRTKSDYLLFWKEEPKWLFNTVDLYKFGILGLTRRCPERHGIRAREVFKPHGMNTIHECCIIHTFNYVMQREIQTAELDNCQAPKNRSTF